MFPPTLCNLPRGQWELTEPIPTHSACRTNISVLQAISARHRCLTETLSSRGEAIPRLTVTAEASRQVQTSCILLAHKSILAFIDI